MNKSPAERQAAVTGGLAQGRKLGVLLRAGKSAKRIRMLGELQENASFHESENLIRSLATCADASLGDDADQSGAIRAAATGFRDVLVAFPPKDKRDWREINDALKVPASAKKADEDEEPVTLRAPAHHVLPTPSSEDHDYGDDENVRYRYLDEKDGS